PTYALVGVAGTPIATAVDHAVVLDFADEQSVVQTRFATTTLVYLLAGLGLNVEAAADDAEHALAAQLPVDPAAADAVVCLGRGGPGGGVAGRAEVTGPGCDVARLHRRRGEGIEVAGRQVQRVTIRRRGEAPVLRERRLCAAEGAHRDQRRQVPGHCVSVR